MNANAYRNLLELYFAQKDGRQIVDHQISSFNHFIQVEVPQTILRSCPVRVTGSPDLSLTGTTRAAAGTAGTAIRVSIEGADAAGGSVPIKTTKPGGPLLSAAAPEAGAPPPREVEVAVEFANVQIRKPTIFENNGAVTPMYPNDARLRNLTYAAPVYTDIIATYTMRAPRADGSGTDTTVRRRTLPHVHVGKIPVMVGSDACLLRDMPEKHPRELGECEADVGGYFIIQGGERVIISQERMSENQPFVFRTSKARNKELEVIDIKSIGPDNEGAPKSLSVKIVQNPKATIAPEHIVVACPRIKAEIPLFVMLRALGVESDREIIELIYGTTDPPHPMIFQECIAAAKGITTRAAAHDWLAANIGSGGGSRESYSANTLQRDRPPRLTTVREILAEECLPHIGGSEMLFEKAAYIAFITRKVLDVYSGTIPHDDRDAYPNKKVELPGNLIGNLFRYLFGTKVIKDMKTTLTKEIHNGFWKSSGRIEDIINPSNIYKILKSTIVTIGMKSALATGNFPGGKMGTKAGLSQVMNRLTYLSGISHLRRVSTPIEKTGKLLAPRKLHATQWGFVCPSETPEGHAVGVVKNLSSTALVSLPSSPEPVVAFLYDCLGMRNLGAVARPELHSGTRVLINGAWIGMLLVDAAGTVAAAEALRTAKRTGRIHPHCGITLKLARREIWINTEGGRLIRPVINAAAWRELEANPAAAPAWLVGSAAAATVSTGWNDVLRWRSPAGGHGLIEYIDATETENFFIAMTPDRLTAEHSHMEIHPSVVLGTMASNIPFPDHNQAPRNSYQSAMGKQAMGVYALNYRERLDTMSNLLWYSSTPLASPYMSRFYRAQDMPSGFNVVVAIMTYGGYNQEDSVMINRASLDRGLFRSEFYRTYKDEEKKNQASGEEERFCRPDPRTTRHMKLANYEKLGPDGIVPENVFVDQDDVLIGKVAPIRLRGADGAAIAGIDHASLQAMSSVAAAAAVEAAGGKRFRDVSKLMRTNESGYVDRIYRGRNGEGYSFVKIRVREERAPVIGDKFASRHGQKGTCGLILEPEDMPQTASGIVPDIIINSHCIPSRMTIAHLMETLLGRLGCEAGFLGDATPFNNAMTLECIAEHLKARGIEPYSNEVMYCGYTGKQMPTEIFMGPIFYQRLKHMVNDKIHCLTPDHEVMTTNGWKSIDSITCDDKVATLQDGRIMYEHPIRTFEYDYIGKMYELKTQQIDLKTTPNHRMWAATCHTRKRIWRYGFHEAQDITGRHVKYQKDGIWEKNDYQFILPAISTTPEKSVDMEAWLTFFGIWIAEGWSNPQKVTLAVNKERVKDALSTALRKLDVKYNYYPSSEKLESSDNQLRTYLTPLSVGAVNKRLPAWVWELSAPQSRILLNGLLLGDGHTTKSGSVVYSTASHQLADDVQRLAFHCGWSANTYIHTPAGSPYSIGDHSGITTSDLWSVRIIKSKNRPAVNHGHCHEQSGQTELWSDYDGKVYCLEVPGNVFYVRRNGLPVWTGNSRSTGPLVMLTRQPAEGRARDGGLRFGEMERDVLIAHGASAFLKERMMEASDNFEVQVCRGCGLIAVANRERNVWSCTGCGNTTEFSQVRIPYAYKLFLQELESMNVSSRLLPETRLRTLADGRS